MSRITALRDAVVAVGLCLSVVLLSITAVQAHPQSQTLALDNCATAFSCGVNGDGAGVAIVEGDLPMTIKDPAKISAKVATTSKFQYAFTFACPSNDPNISNMGADVSCNYAVTACAGLNIGPGPMTWTWRRRTSTPPALPTEYERISRSCAAPAVTGPGAERVLTVGMVRDAFRRVNFALPAVNVQPEGNVTLVNLPTFFEVQWPELGVQPREIAEVQLLGRNVQIRPVGKSFVYRFGDGDQMGPTSDMGGPYPEGKVRHTYTRPAKSAMVSVVATYGGVFSVDEGPWQEVGETITINGPAEGVQVLEARARLEAG